MGKNKLKKILLILGFLLFVVLMAYLIWNFFFKKPVSTPSPEPTPIYDPSTGLPISPEGPGQIIPGIDPGRMETSSEIIPPQKYPDPIQDPATTAPDEIARGGITKTKSLVEKKAANVTASRDGSSLQFYNQDDGRFYLVNNEGDLIPLSDRVFHNVENVEWAPNKTKAVLEYPDNTKIVYDFSTQKQVTLPKHWEDFSFSTDSNKLVSKNIGMDPESHWLITSNADGSQVKYLEYIGKNADKVISSWSPNNQTVAMYVKPIDFDRREVFFVGLHDENFRSTIVHGWNFSGTWDENGDRLLYSVASTDNDLKPNLWIVDARGDNIGRARTDLKIETWVEKCTFANKDEIYCAVPTSLPEGAGTMPELAANTHDNLYKINLKTKRKELVAIPDETYNISSLILSQDGKTLFFTDRAMGGIHTIKLP